MYDEGKQYTYNVHIPAVVSCTYQGNKKKERVETIKCHLRKLRTKREGS